MENTWPWQKSNKSQVSRTRSAEEGVEGRKAMPRAARTADVDRKRAFSDWGQNDLEAAKWRLIGNQRARPPIWKIIRATMRRTGRRAWSCWEYRPHRRPSQRRPLLRAPGASRTSSKIYRSPTKHPAASGVYGVRRCKDSPIKRLMCSSTVCLDVYFRRVTRISTAPLRLSRKGSKYLRRRQVSFEVDRVTWGFLILQNFHSSCIRATINC